MSLLRLSPYFSNAFPNIPRERLTLTLALGSLVALSLIKKLRKFFAIRRNTILELDLRFKAVVDTPPSPIHELLGDEKILVLSELIESLDLASKNKNIRAIIVRLGKGLHIELASIQELRNAILRFKSSGKIALAYADTFGELENSVGLYYFASVFNAIYLPPSGTVSIQHLVSDTPFIKGTLEKLGISAKLGQRREYKNFANTLTEDSFTPAHREVTHNLLSTIFQQIVDGISVERNLDRDRIISAFSKSPFPASEALREGLIDGIMYSDEVYDHLHEVLELSPKKSTFLFTKSFLKTVGRRYEHKNPFYAQIAPKRFSRQIALIVASGDILLGESQKGDSPSIGSDTVVSALRVAAKNPNIKAIVMRVNSRGGSYVPCDLIYHEIIRARKAGKKVVVSFGNYAASGGYFISMAADKIIAQPGTLTGSIGVIYGKFLTKELCNKIGLTHDFAWNGPVDSRPPPENYNSGTFYSSLHDYDERQLRTREELLDLMYEDFTNRVAQNRGLSRDQVEEIAKGRVWLGSQALDLGLVDKLGGLDDAIREAQQLSGIPLNVTPEIVVYPKKVNVLQQLLRPPKNSDEKQKRGSGGVVSMVQNFGVIGSWIGTFRVLSNILVSLGDLQPSLKTALAQTHSIVKNQNAELLCTAPELFLTI